MIFLILGAFFQIHVCPNTPIFEAIINCYLCHHPHLPVIHPAKHTTPSMLLYKHSGRMVMLNTSALTVAMSWLLLLMLITLVVFIRAGQHLPISSYIMVLWFPGLARNNPLPPFTPPPAKSLLYIRELRRLFYYDPSYNPSVSLYLLHLLPMKITRAQ